MLPLKECAEKQLKLELNPNFIISSFQKDENGHFIHIDTKADYEIADVFYEANWRYNLFYTCNTCANSALKHCGQRAAL